MPNKKLSQEDPADTLTGDEQVRIVQGGETVRTTTGDIAALGGGPGGGTPGGSDTQVQFNDAGSFGGDPGLTYNKTTNVLSLNGSANSLNLGGSAASNPVALSATGSDSNISIKLTPKGTGFVQFGPQTYGPFNAFSEAYGTALPSGHFGHYVDSTLGDHAGGFLFGMDVLVYTQGAGATQDVGGITGGLFNATAKLPAGRTCTNAYGVNFATYNTGAGTLTNGYGVAGTVYGGSGTITNAYCFYGNLFQDVGATITNGYGFYVPDLTGTATNAYQLWLDTPGVFRIRNDALDGAGKEQAIPALYNPQFTKYTPGAANYERIVLAQWNGNVAEIGTEAGGTGTLRPIKFIGAAPTVTGSRGGNAALADLLTKLATLGLIVDGTS